MIRKSILVNGSCTNDYRKSLVPKKVMVLANISSRKSEANASDFLENIEEMFPR